MTTNLKAIRNPRRSLKPVVAPAAGTPKRGAASSRKVLRMLMAFAPDRPFATVEALAAAAGVPMSSAYRYVALLREVGLLAEDGQGAYHLTPRVIRLAKAAQAALSFVDIARPVMQQLAQASGETVLLVRRFGDSAICIERAESADPIRLSLEIGTPFPLHQGASPKLLLANLPPVERDAYLVRAARADRGFKARLAAFRAELERIRKARWSASAAEITPEIWAAAAPVLDDHALVAALSVAGPSYRLRQARVQERIITLTRDAADVISRALGHGPADWRIGDRDRGRG